MCFVFLFVCFNNARIAQQLFVITQSITQTTHLKTLDFEQHDNVQRFRYLQVQIYAFNVGVSGARAVIN